MDLNEGSTEKKDEASQNSQPQEEQKPKLQFANPKLQQILEGKLNFYMPK
jgi:hypothetical protein